MYEAVVSLRSIALYALTEGLGMLCFSTKSASIRKLLFVALTGLIYFQLYHTKIEMGGFSTQYGIGCRLGSVLCFVFECVFKKDPQEFRWIGDKKDSEVMQTGSVDATRSNGKVNGGTVRKGNGARHDDISTGSFYKRFLWGASLYCNPRGVGWAHEEPATLPARPSSWKTRSGFIRSQIGYIVICWILHDLNLTLMRRNPYFMGIKSPNDASLTLRALWLAHRGVGEGLLIGTGLMLNLCHNAVILAVIGLTDLAAWRPVLGSISDAYTVRNVWGKVWHQFYRRPFTIIASTMADALQLPKRTKTRTYFVLFAVFAASTFVHSFGNFVLAGSWLKTTEWTFFMPQVAGIWFEDTVMRIGRKAGLRRNFFTTVLGYGWVLVWFAFITGTMTESHAKGGYFSDRMEISVIDGLLTGQWEQYPHTRVFKIY